jgi:putative copper resistance protein D
MLALAAANRWRLTPALSAAITSGEPAPDRKLAAMRTSLALEAAAAVLILALVAWFGTLEPFVSAGGS